MLQSAFWYSQETMYVTADIVMIVHVRPMSVMAKLLASNTMTMGQDMKKKDLLILWVQQIIW